LHGRAQPAASGQALERRSDAPHTLNLLQRVVARCHRDIAHLT
jgi:hypothetical protein